MKEKISSLQALRGIACLSVLFSHTTGVIPGTWGVSVFFVLSGFLMQMSYRDRQDIPCGVMGRLSENSDNLI